MGGRLGVPKEAAKKKKTKGKGVKNPSIPLGKGERGKKLGPRIIYNPSANTSMKSGRSQRGKGRGRRDDAVKEREKKKGGK